MKKKNKSSVSVSLFSNPDLSDRELMLLVLYEITRLRADVKTALKMAAKTNPEISSQVASFFELSDAQAFAELAEDIRQFQVRRQNPPAN